MANNSNSNSDNSRMDEEERRVFLDWINGLNNFQLKEQSHEQWRMGMAEALEEIIILLRDIREQNSDLLSELEEWNLRRRGRQRHHGESKQNE